MPKLLKSALAVSLLSLLSTPAAAMTRDQAVRAALDDEYGAQATYLATIEAHGAARPFTNILRAETMHEAMLKDYATSHGITVPTNPYIGQLPAPASLAEACATGIQAEIDNAGLYRNRLLPAAQGDTELTAIFTKLMTDSQQKHLQAFQRCGGTGGQQAQGQQQGRAQGRTPGKGHGPRWKS